MPATAAVSAGIKVRLFGHPAQLERFGEVLADRFLDGVHRLLGLEKSLVDRAAKEDLSALFKIGDFRHVERRAGLLLVLQQRAAIAQFLVLHADFLVRQKEVHLPADVLEVGLVQDHLAKFPGLLEDQRVFRIQFHRLTLLCLRIGILSSFSFHLSPQIMTVQSAAATYCSKVRLAMRSPASSSFCPASGESSFEAWSRKTGSLRPSMFRSESYPARTRAVKI